MSAHRALRVFVQFLERGRRLDGQEFDEFCREHSELEPALRRLATERLRTAIEPPRVARGPARARGFLGQWRAKKRYVLLGEAGRGGMGVILHVWDTVLERPVAMKMLDQDALPKDRREAKEVLARFLAEARTAAQLEHPGVVPIHDLGTDELGRAYFTMPFIEGRTLDQVFDLARSRAAGWSLWRALRVLSQVCEVVAYAHAHGVIHRDLKPANLITGAFGEVYVVDWGLAKSTGEALEHGQQGRAPSAGVGQTMNGTVAGTPPYMAPEQAEGRVADVSYRSDVYALGAMLYRLLAGRSPYAPRQGEDEPEKIVELIRRGPPTPLARLAPDAPAELVAIAEKAMARDPEDRYAGVEELGRELDAFLEGSVSAVRFGARSSEPEP